MKKTLSLILAALLAAAALTGCAGQTTSSKSDTPSGSASTTTSKDDKADLKNATLNVWLVGPGTQANSNAVWEEFNTKLKETLPNTSVNFTIIPGSEYKDKFTNAMAGQEAIDLAWVGYATSLNQDQRDGNLMALDDLLAKYGQGIIDSVGQNVIDVHRYTDGKLYYILSWQSIFESRNGVRGYKDIADLVSPTWEADTQKAADTAFSNPTLDNMQALFDKYAEYGEAAKQNGKLFGGFDPVAFTYDELHKFGGEYYRTSWNNVGVQVGDDTFTVKARFDSDFYRLYAQNMADFFKKGYFTADIASKEFADDSKGAREANTPILSSHNCYEEADAWKAQNKAVTGADRTMVVFNKYGNLGSGSATGMAIPFTAKEPERAMMFLNEMFTNKELYQLLIYGRKGIDYTDNGDGTITTGYGSQGKEDSKYGLWKWTIGTCVNSLVTEGDTKGYYDYLKEKEKTAYVNPFVGFAFDNTKVKDICSSLAAIDKEYEPQIGKGLGGDDWKAIYDKWMSERKAAGEDQLIAEVQAQFDAYRKEKNITSWNWTPRV